MMKNIYLISGPPGSGKSTLARELCNSFSKSIHIECDVIYNMVKGGFLKPWEDGARSLLDIMYDGFVVLASVYVKAGFVVVSDYVWNFDEIEVLKNKFSNNFSIEVCFLLPRLEINLQRDANRKYAIGVDRVKKFHADFVQIQNSYPEFFYDNSKIYTNEIIKKLISFAEKE